MSNQAITQAWAIQGVSITQKCVLVRLADRAGDDMTCWPCIDNIAAECCCNRVTVIRCLKELRDLGYVTWFNRANADGSTTSNMYRLKLPSVSVADGKATVSQSNTGVAQSNPTQLQAATGGVAQCNSNPHLNPQSEPTLSIDAQANPSKPIEYPPDFSCLYDKHPSKGQRHAAYKHYGKLKAAEKDALAEYCEANRATWTQWEHVKLLRTIISDRDFMDPREDWPCNKKQAFGDSKPTKRQYTFEENALRMGCID